jgi:beta-glucosidase
MPIKTEMPTPFPVPRHDLKQSSPAVLGEVGGDGLLDTEALLGQLSSEEKIRLLSGDDMWHTVPVPRLGIPRVRVSDNKTTSACTEYIKMSDGPNGVRGTACALQFAWKCYIVALPDHAGTNGAASACFPCATGLAASFDVRLASKVGKALGRECRARGVHCLLGPTTNIQRHPCGGRGFESFSEGVCDPFIRFESVLMPRSNTCGSHG